MILPVGLKKKKADLFEDDLVLKLVMEELNDIEIICQFKAPKATKEVLVLLAEDAKGFDS